MHIVTRLSLERMLAKAEEFTILHTWCRNCSMLQDVHALAWTQQTNNQRAAHSHGNVILKNTKNCVFWHRSHVCIMWRLFNIANEKNSNEDRDEIGDMFTF